MVRGKVKLQRIDDAARRMVSFSKRRSGLLKKARELAVLCDAEVAVVVFSPKGKLSLFTSQSSLEKTFERCKRFLDEERKVKNNVLIRKGKSAEFADHEMNRGLKVDQRLLDDGLIEHDINELTKLEDKVESELRKVRLRKTALLKDSGANLQDPVRCLIKTPTRFSNQFMFTMYDDSCYFLSRICFKK
nr:MADS-box transcription factor [Spirodela polyrhiza]